MIFRKTILLFFLFASLISFSQSPKAYDAAEIQLMLEKLNVLGSVMYIAAHPDDENTRLITYFGKKKNYEVGYLALTRGDGGQNLIGTEKGELLGLIRTEELLAARRIDGGEQFFSRANDFGYSKTYQETLNIWDEQKVLSDMVFAIRKFKPDVLVTRFPPLKYNYNTHGHHTTSAYLAEKAFDLAADPKAFPEQLTLVETWQPKRLYWNTSTWFYKGTGQVMDTLGKLIIDVGAYLPELGMSCTEIAAMSRSQHKTQGFGVEKTRGSEMEFLAYVKGDSAASDLMEGIDITWNRVKGGKEIAGYLKQARDNFEVTNPEAVLPDLLKAYQLLSPKRDYWSKKKTEELKKTIQAVCGLFMESLADDYSATPGSKVSLENTLLNRCHAAVKFKNVSYSMLEGARKNDPADLQYNEPFQFVDTLILSQNASISQPYWLVDPMDGIGMYHVSDQSLIGRPESPKQVVAHYTVNIAGVDILYDVPVKFKWTDRVKGELYRDFIVTPPVTVNLKDKVLIFSDQNARKVLVRVKAWEDQVTGILKLDLPEGWKSEPSSEPVDLKKKGDEKTFSFNIIPGKQAGVYDLQPVITTSEGSFKSGSVELDYDHIPIQNVWPVSDAKLVRLDIAIKGSNIGYIMGAGDELPENLRQIGYQITFLDENNMAEADLSVFDAIIVGIRAYNTQKWLLPYHDKLMNFVSSGGNLIVQYQTTGGLLANDFGPYPFKIGRDRVTVEQAPMLINDPSDALFNQPNKIIEKDFENWVQERGLYFASEWDEKYQTPFTSNDPGEEPVRGSVIMTPYGKGTFIYTGISFFRQLPAGVPGAFRLLANMISYNK